MKIRDYVTLALAAGLGAAAGAGGTALSQPAAIVADTGVLETDDVRRLEQEIEGLCNTARASFATIRELRRQRAEVNVTSDGQAFEVFVPSSAGMIRINMPARGERP